jgi:polyisoprenoid-binding protein YceI
MDAAHSTLTFTGTQAGDAFHGGFEKFTPVIEFDPAHPETGKIKVTVDTASAFIDNDEDKNASLPNEEWFATKQFPTATFSSTAIHPASRLKSAGPAFEVEGNLTLRGITKPVKLSFELIDKGNGIFEARGSTELKRNDFGIGQGKEWASDQWVAYPVKVSFTVVAEK